MMLSLNRREAEMLSCALTDTWWQQYSRLSMVSRDIDKAEIDRKLAEIQALRKRIDDGLHSTQR